MSGHCDFCQMWHSASCCHPGRFLLTQAEDEVARLTARVGELEAKCAGLARAADECILSLRDVVEARDRWHVKAEAAEARLREAEQFVSRCHELGATDTDIVKHALEDQARIREELTPLSIRLAALTACARALLDKLEAPSLLSNKAGRELAALRTCLAQQET